MCGKGIVMLAIISSGKSLGTGVKEKGNDGWKSVAAGAEEQEVAWLCGLGFCVCRDAFISCEENIQKKPEMSCWHIIHK